MEEDMTNKRFAYKLIQYRFGCKLPAEKYFPFCKIWIVNMMMRFRRVKQKLNLDPSKRGTFHNIHSFFQKYLHCTSFRNTSKKKPENLLQDHSKIALIRFEGGRWG